jgi:hypothetical protein
MEKADKRKVKKKGVSDKNESKEITKVNIYMGAPDQMVLKSVAGEIVWHVPDFTELMCSDCICHCDCGNCACHCDCACVCNCDCDCCIEMHGINVEEFYKKVDDVTFYVNTKFGEIKEILDKYRVEKEGKS